MKTKRIIALILSALMISCALASCSSGKDVDVTKATTEAQQSTTATTTTQAQEQLEKSVTIEDEKGNLLNTTIIYNVEGKKALAGYVVSAKDKNGKALTKKEYSLINQVLQISAKDDEYELVKDKDKKIISILSYCDKSSNVIAMQDIFDVDANKNATELLQIGVNSDGLTCVQKDSKGVALKVTVSKDKSGKLYVVYADGKRVEVNATVSPKAAAKTTQKTTVSTTKAKPLEIVLQKNGKATTTAKQGVTLASQSVKITKAGDYVIKSAVKEWHGQIFVSLPNTAKCSIKFENVNISFNKGNIIQILDSSIKAKRTYLGFKESEASADDIATDNALNNEIEKVSDNEHAPNVSLSFPEGTNSTFTSTSNDFVGAIYNEAKLTFKGKGTVNIKSKQNANNCLCTTKSVTFKNVTTNMTTEANTLSSKLSAGLGSAKGIFSQDKVTVESGKLYITSNGDGIRCGKFFNEGGTVIIKSSACDAIDADNVIELNAGSTACTALEKYAYKVRRVDATENKQAKGGVRAGKNDGFRINGGTVKGESKKTTSLTKDYQSDKKDSKQASIICKIQKKDATGAVISDSKVPAKFSIGTLKINSANQCLKFVYSSPKVKKGTEYNVSISSGDNKKVVWTGNAGVALLESATNK